MEQLTMFAPTARPPPAFIVVEASPPCETARPVAKPAMRRRSERPAIASSLATQCEATTAAGRRCSLEIAIRKGCPRGFCAVHARRAAERELVLALFCADVEVWDVARRTGVSEDRIHAILNEARDVRARVRRAIDAYRATA